MNNFDETKQLFLDELTSLEKSLFNLLQKHLDLKEEFQKIKEENIKLEMKNKALKEALDDFKATKSAHAGLNLSSEERDSIKERIDKLISKIDTHLNS